VFPETSTPIGAPPPLVEAGLFPVAGDAIIIKRAIIDGTGQETCLQVGNNIVSSQLYSGLARPLLKEKEPRVVKFDPAKEEKQYLQSISGKNPSANL